MRIMSFSWNRTETEAQLSHLKNYFITRFVVAVVLFPHTRLYILQISQMHAPNKALPLIFLSDSYGI